MPLLKFRQDTVRGLPYAGHGKGQCIYWDEGFECFGVRVYPSGRRVYVCCYRIYRRKRLATLGRVDVLTLDQARKKATAYLGKVAANQDPQNELDQLRAARTVKEVVDAYIEKHAKLKKKTWKQDESCLRRLLLPKFGARLAATVTSAEIQEIHSEKGTTNPYAANSFLEVVRKMYNWAKKPANLIPKDCENPVTGIQRFPQRKRKRFITRVEMPRFLQALEQEDSDYARHAIWLLLLTGLRMRELLKAKWEHVDWDMGTLFIGLTKNGEPLLAPLSEAAIGRLKIIPKLAGNPHIICGRVPGEYFKDLGPVLRRILRRAGLTNVRIHDLRRTVGSWLAHSGVSLHLIGDVLNHLDPSTTAGYAYFQTQHRREALSSHADKVLELGGPHLRTPEEVKTLTAEVLLPASDPAQPCTNDSRPARYRHYFKREGLYELVWTAPVSEVARRLGVSDKALAKLCYNAAIPIPPRGYWAKIDAGRIIPRTPLPFPPDGLPQLLRILGRAPTAEAQGGKI